MKPVRTRHPVVARELVSLAAIKAQRESQAPGGSYRLIHEKLADATKELLLSPTNYPWPIVEKAIREGVRDSRITFGERATSIALKSMGLGKFDLP